MEYVKVSLRGTEKGWCVCFLQGLAESLTEYEITTRPASSAWCDHVIQCAEAP